MIKERGRLQNRAEEQVSYILSHTLSHTHTGGGGTTSITGCRGFTLKAGISGGNTNLMKFNDVF